MGILFNENTQKAFDGYAQGHQSPPLAGALPTKFLMPTREAGSASTSYTIVDKVDGDISTYAFDRLQEIEDQLRTETNQENRDKLVQIGKWIKQDFEAVDAIRGFGSRLWNRILVGVGLRHSSKEIQQEMADIERLQSVPQFGGMISMEDADKRIKAHREAGVNNQKVIEDYAKDSLTSARDKLFKELLKTNPPPDTEPQKQIATAKLKERAAKEVYDKQMQGQIDKGYFDPAVIPREIDKMLGPVKMMPLQIEDQYQLDKLLQKEVQRYKVHLSSHQVDYIKDDIQETMKLYLLAFYPQRTLMDAFALGRDMIRVSVYQEIWDKSVFSGSDHGSKHIHHNIKNGDGLHSKMRQNKDFNAKDQFMEHFIHVYHDIGYTTGLSANSFDCCKDHPFIGAKMIEANRDYFKYYLGGDDEADKSVDVFKEGVLYHAIAMPNLTTDKPEAMRAGMHPNLIRAVTSISDACAVTYDRKTQEFWEQPACLIALSRLRLFLTQYPEYTKKLSDPGKDEWFGGKLDKNNPLDVLAHDVFKATKDDLFKAADEYDVPKAKRNLFKQAIAQQFNSFTTATTLGQYGGVLTGVSAVRNEDRAEGAPTYLPEFELAPSIIYGLLKDVYGEDLAQQSFKKLLEEFGVPIETISGQLNLIAEARVQDKIVPERNFITKLAKFTLRNLFDVDPKDKHLKQMQKNLAKVVGSIKGIYQSERAIMPSGNKATIFKELEKFRQSPDTTKTFADFITEKVIPGLNVTTPQGLQVTQGLNMLTSFVRENDPFAIVKSAEKEWDSLLAQLKTHNTPGVVKDAVENYIKEVRKLRGKLPAAEDFNKPKNTVIEAARKIQGFDVALLEKDLNELQKILSNSSFVERSKKAEAADARIQQITVALRMIFMSAEEYRFMRGDHPQTQSALVQQLLGEKNVA